MFSFDFSLLVNCFLLLIPIFAWNLILARRLPASYRAPIWDQIPRPLAWAEGGLRIAVLGWPLVMRLELASPVQVAGLILFGGGLGVYCAAWVLQLGWPDSRWSRSRLGFTAPAWTSGLWLAGLGLIGQHLSLPVPSTAWIYLGVALAFLVVHTSHAWLVWSRRSLSR